MRRPRLLDAQSLNPAIKDSDFAVSGLLSATENPLPKFLSLLSTIRIFQPPLSAPILFADDLSPSHTSLSEPTAPNNHCSTDAMDQSGSNQSSSSATRQRLGQSATMPFPQTTRRVQKANIPRRRPCSTPSLPRSFQDTCTCHTQTEDPRPSPSVSSSRD